MYKSKSKKKLKLQDITNYSNSREHPFSYSKSPTAKINPNYASSSSTELLNSFTIMSPSNMECCHKNRGIMKQAIAERIEYYKRDYKKKFLRKTMEDVRQETKEKQYKQLRESPILNEQSQKLYKKVAEKRNLSPKVLVRFEQYERSKTLHKLKLKIETYYNETRKIPRPQQIISPGKLGQMEQAKKLINSLNESINKFVTKHKYKQNRECQDDQ